MADIEVIESYQPLCHGCERARCDAICDGDGGRSSCFTPWCRCTVCHGPAEPQEGSTT